MVRRGLQVEGAEGGGSAGCQERGAHRWAQPPMGTIIMHDNAEQPLCDLFTGLPCASLTSMHDPCGLPCAVFLADGAWKYEYGYTNIEYTEFGRLGMSDMPTEHNSTTSKFPANTNVLYVNLHAAASVVEQVRERAPMHVCACDFVCSLHMPDMHARA